MKLRIEFFRSRSNYFRAAVSVCKKAKHHNIIGHGESAMYMVWCDTRRKKEFDEFRKLFRMCGGWKANTYYIGRKQVSHMDMWRYLSPVKGIPVSRLPDGTLIRNSDIIDIDVEYKKLPMHLPLLRESNE